MRDLTDFLSEWPYDPASCVRKVAAGDGRKLIQVRTPLGIEQYELGGRPDGDRPHGCASLLDYIEEQILSGTGAGEGDEFELDRDGAVELQNEGLLYYYRYLVCFQIGEYGVVARDTARNLRMFDVVRAYCKDKPTVESSEQYRPYLVRMNAAARVLLAVGADKPDLARAVVQKATESIAALPDVATATFEYEKDRSLAILRGMLRAIPNATPRTEEDVLSRELRRAVEEENYERAAELRDRLRDLAVRREHSASRNPGA